MKNYLVRELRDMSGLTQKAFAEHFDIPLSTLQKWEHRTSSPPRYVINMIANSLPGTDKQNKKYICNDGTVFYWNPIKKTVSDSLGNSIKIREDLSDIKEQNLKIYLRDLFDKYYEIRKSFEMDCEYDRKEDFLWS